MCTLRDPNIFSLLLLSPLLLFFCLSPFADSDYIICQCSFDMNWFTKIASFPTKLWPFIHIKSVSLRVFYLSFSSSCCFLLAVQFWFHFFSALRSFPFYLLNIVELSVFVHKPSARRATKKNHTNKLIKPHKMRRKQCCLRTRSKRESG